MDQSGSELTLTDLGQGRYRFTMPASKVSIRASFAPEGASAEISEENIPETPVFIDIPNDSYCHDAALWAWENRVTSGTDSTHFTPDRVCTRGQIVTLLYRLLGQS